MIDNPLSPIKVSYERKTEITVNQPEDVTRAKASAWLDIISPVTQWAGLKGDALSHKRALLRIEQEASLMNLAYRLKKKLDGKTVTPLAAQVLIPALEGASLENSDEMIERWAELLASAATSPGQDVRVCVSILRDLGAEDAQLAESIYRKYEGTRTGPLRRLADESFGGLDCFRQIDGERLFRASWVRSNDYYPEPERTKYINASRNEVSALLDALPYLVFEIVFFPDESEKKPVASKPIWVDRYQVNADVLRYRNIIRERDAMIEVEDREARWLSDEANPPVKMFGKIQFHYYELTKLGLMFLSRVSGR